jgi:uncharacterized protein with GYD domain
VPLEYGKNQEERAARVVQLVVEAPDNTTAAAIAMAVGASGISIETTVLLDMDEAQEAMRKAAKATYRPPTA